MSDEMNVGKRLQSIEARLARLEGYGTDEPGSERVTMYITLPAMDIGGLSFNEQKVFGLFRKYEVWYRCSNILFLSARNSERSHDRDVLTEYLASEAVLKAFKVAWPGDNKHLLTDIRLPDENVEGGIEKLYNGVEWWYWLAGRGHHNTEFKSVHKYIQDVTTSYADVLGGVAPMFRF